MSCIAPSRWIRHTAVVVALVISVPWYACQTVGADQLKEDSSLKFAPADVSFFVAGLRMREVFDKVATSNAITKLKTIPSVQFGLAMAMQQWAYPQNPQLAMFKQMLEDPANQGLIDLIKDAVSHEIFIYGDDKAGELLALINEASTASNAAQMEALSAGDFGSEQAYQTRAMLELLEKRGGQLPIPTLVKGMKLSDTQRGVDQLARLEGQIQALLAQQPTLQPRFSREQVAGVDYLTLRLDGTLIPWPMLESGIEGIEPQEMQKLSDTLKGLTLVISIGVREEYLLVSVGPDNKHLAALGQGKLLYDRDEMAPIRQAVDKPITQIAFVDAQFSENMNSVDGQVDQVVTMVKQFAPFALGDASELQDELASDVETLGQLIKDSMPEAVSISGYQYLTPEGFESFGYNWSTESMLDASQNLTILDHVGGDPIAFYAARGKPDPETYDGISQFVTRLAYYVEQIGMQQLDEDQIATFQKLKGQIEPLAAQLGAATRDKLIPGFADGQSAFVMDAKSASASWFAMMPPAEEELPMLELGMVLGVSNAQLVKEGFSEYFDVLQKALDLLHEASNGDLRDLFSDPVPEIKLAQPQSREINGGTVYYYPLPDESGLDAQLAPNAGLSDKVMVTSLLPRFTARLLSETSLSSDGPLTRASGPLAAAYQLQFAALLEALTPWVDYGVGMSMAVSTQGQPDAGPMGNIPQQIHDVMDVLKCFRGISGVTYLEGNAMVTHSQWRFEDLP